MVVRISSSLLDTILAHAARAPDQEVCGLLFGADDAILASEPAANVHASPARHFEVDPAALIAAHKAERAGGLALIGHYHSHPSGSPFPSDEDVRLSEPGRLSLIIGGGEARLYRSVGGTLQAVALASGQF